MLKRLLALCLLSLFSMPVLARTNAEIGKALYRNADRVSSLSTARAEKMREDIASFLMDLSMLHFDESSAVWLPLGTGFYYDSRSLQHFNLRHTGVYKSSDGLMMGTFDLYCEDFNDPQERMYGYVKTTDVYFSDSYRKKNGHSKGFAKKFCK